MISINLNGPYHVGAIRWNGSTRNLEVMDQSGGWHSMHISATEPYPAAPDMVDLLNWVRQERDRKAKLKQLRDKYPTLDEALRHAEVIEALVEDHGQSSGIAPSMIP